MYVLAAFLFMHHDGARVSLQAQFFFEDIHGACPLLRRHLVMRLGVDVGVVEAFGALRALGEDLPVPERFLQLAGRGLELEDADALVRVGAKKMLRELGGGTPAMTLDDHDVAHAFWRWGQAWVSS